MSHQLKEWRTMRTNPLHKIELMLDRAEDMRATNRLHDAMIYLTRIWNAIDGGFYPLGAGGEVWRDKGYDFDAEDIQSNLWWAILRRCPWAFYNTSNVNSIKFTYRDN